MGEPLDRIRETDVAPGRTRPRPGLRAQPARWAMPPRESHTITGLSNQALVHIEIVGGRINCFPQRAGDTIIFNCWDPKTPPQARPREVRWVVTGLQPGQFVRIEPKDDASGGLFHEPPVLVVQHGFNTVTSGCALMRAGAGRNLTFAYNVVLYESTDGKPQELDRLDPVIIIKDYP
jgi:hypothetical protein